MLSRGSSGSSCVVNRYDCAATKAASGVSCIIFSSSSAAKNELRLSFPDHPVLLLLCFGSRCLSSLDSDVSLYSSHYDLIDALLDSWLLLSLLFSCSSFFLC
jgi:hypothetical protein